MYCGSIFQRKRSVSVSMFLLRTHPKGARFASFGIGLCIFALMPRETGYQDIASLLARQPGVAERWQKQVFSAASSIQLATYSFSRPIGTSVPQSPMVRLASLDGRDVSTDRFVSTAEARRCRQNGSHNSTLTFRFTEQFSSELV